MRRKRFAVKILVYLTLIVGLAGIVFCLGYRATHPVDDSHGTEREQRHTQTQIVAVQPAQHRKTGNDNQKYAAKWFEPITILTFLLVVGVVVTACIYHGQLKEMRKTVVKVGEQGETMKAQLEAMVRQEGHLSAQSEAMQGQLSAIKDQAEIMRKQAKSMDESVVFGLRAYLGVHSVGANFGYSDERITLKIENTGKVPASKIKVEVFAVVETPIEISTDSPKFFDKELIAYYFANYDENKLFPGNLPIQIVMPIRDDFDVERHQILIEEGGERLIVRGNINFFDGFHTDKNTPFVFRYVGNGFWTPDPVHEERETKEETEKPN